MTVSDLISNAVVERALGAPREDAGGAWLTFFLRFPNERARAVLRILEGIGLQLDDDRSARCFYAKARIGRNAVEICRLAGRVQNGTFPRNVSISERCVGWRESAIGAWLRNPMFYSVDDNPAR